MKNNCCIPLKNPMPMFNRCAPTLRLTPWGAYAAMFVKIKMQQMPKVCGSFHPVHQFLTHVLLCCSVCVDKRRSKEAIKTLHSIGARRQEFLYKHESSGICGGTLLLTRTANTYMKTHLHMNMEQGNIKMRSLLGVMRKNNLRMWNGCSEEPEAALYSLKKMSVSLNVDVEENSNESRIVYFLN